MSINYEKHGQHHWSSRKYKLTQYNFPHQIFFFKRKTPQVLVRIQETRQLLALLYITIIYIIIYSVATMESNLTAKAKNVNSYDLANSF